MGHMYWRYFMWQFVGKQSDSRTPAGRPASGRSRRRTA